MNWQNHIYINLDKRKDRNENVRRQLKKLNIIEPNRFSAIETKYGIVGCAFSHSKVIKDAKEKNLPYICVFEDDIEILDAKQLMKKVDKYIDTDFDVLMLAGNNFGGQRLDHDLLKVERCYTTTAYIIKQHYYDTWLENLRDGVENLIRTRDRNYSLDVFNHQLQKKDKWYLLTPIQIIQIEGWSDIEKRNVNYEALMLNYQK